MLSILAVLHRQSVYRFLGPIYACQEMTQVSGLENDLSFRAQTLSQTLATTATSTTTSSGIVLNEESIMNAGVQISEEKEQGHVTIVHSAIFRKPCYPMMRI